MKYQAYPEGWLVRLEVGDEILESLTRLCEAEDIRLAQVSGIGAANDVTVGIFDTKRKVYTTSRHEGEFEIAQLTGNITRQDGKPYLHIHITVCNPVTGEFAAGHLSRAVISATAEIFVRRWSGEAGRKFSEEVGLNLLEF